MKCSPIRVAKADEAKKITKPYKEMGKSFAGNNGFQQEKVKKFAGPDYLSHPNRALCSLLFKTLAKKKFAEVSMEWGCTVPLDYRPWEQ